MKLLGIILIILVNSLAEISPNELIFREKQKLSLPNQTGERIIKIAKSFLGKPYVAHTLEINEDEKLVVNLSEFDCETFVESVLAIEQTQRKPDENFENFKENLQKLRYYNGVINGYTSRIHYFSDWLFENQNNGKIELIDFKGYSIDLKKEISFMSQHSKSYPQLSDETQLLGIQKVEELISKRNLNYVPKESIEAVVAKLKEGDLVAFTSSVIGLDIAHEGFATIVNGQIHLLHASLDFKKIIISQETLIQYLNSHKKMSGIVVARIL